jgi:predicted ArsR family transcriptional regulator
VTPSAIGPPAAGPDVADLEAVPDIEQRTRDRVCGEVLARGPVSAADLAKLLSLTPAAVRRHLDVLLAQDLVAVWEAPGRAQARGRGRPARRFVGTDAGHAALWVAYDDLAASALRYLTRVAGDGAVRSFADERVAQLEQRYRPAVDAVGPQPLRRAQALAEALSGDGYAASTRPLELAGHPFGTQLCQGHCPVQHVAREFPQLCEAETEAFSRLLGVHVQRLATLAHGEHVCTTHVPVPPFPTVGLAEPADAGTVGAHSPGTSPPTRASTSTHNAEHPDHAGRSTRPGDEEMTPR